MIRPVRAVAAGLAEARRRHVLRVAVVYIVGGWAVIEALSTILPALAVPEWAVSLVVAVVCLGFPLALALAWAFELTPDGLRRATPGVAGTPAPATHPAAPAAPIAAAPQAAPTPAPATLAVLPFASLSASPDDSYLSDGISDEILSALSRVPGLRVASRTSAAAYRERREDVRRIGRELNVATVLEGSVQRAAGRLRVTTQLVDVADGYQLWSARFDSPIEDVFAIEDEIAARVAGALQLILREEDRAALTRQPTSDVRAYEHYLRGRQFFNQARRKSLRYAREMFARAIELDPHYAPAHAGLADANSLLRMYYPAGEADMEEAERASLRALALAPQSPEAHSARGAVLFLTRRLAEAEEEFRTAMRLGPQLFEARYLFARMCFQLGRVEEAARLFEEAAALREDYQAVFFAAQCYEALARPATAAERYRHALRVVERHMELNPDDPRAATMRAVALYRVGERAAGLQWAERALQIDPEDAGVRYNVACLYAVAGETEPALHCLEDAVRVGFGNRDWLEHDPDLAPVRADPRFAALLQGM